MVEKVRVVTKHIISKKHQQMIEDIYHSWFGEAQAPNSGCYDQLQQIGKDVKRINSHVKTNTIWRKALFAFCVILFYGIIHMIGLYMWGN